MKKSKTCTSGLPWRRTAMSLLAAVGMGLTPSASAQNCGGTLNVQISPGPFVVGDVLNALVVFGPPLGSDDQVIDLVKLELDCTTSISCAGGSICTNDGNALCYRGDAFLTSPDLLAGTFSSDLPGGGCAANNEVAVTLNPAILLTASENRTLNFGLRVNALSTDATPFRILGRFSYDGLCGRIAGGGCGSFLIRLTTPSINVVKSANPTIVCPGVTTPVTYSYVVTNTTVGDSGIPAADLALSNIVVTDNMCGPVTFTGGDTDGDGELDLTESWTYTCVANISQQTTNIVTAEGDLVLPASTTHVTDTDTETVNLYPVIVVNVNGPSACIGNSGNLCGTITGGTAPYSAQWFLAGNPVGAACANIPAGGQCCISVSSTAVHTIVVTDANGCVREGSGNLTNFPAKVITAVDNSICESLATGELCATVNSGTPPYSVQWFNGAVPVGAPCAGLGNNQQCCVTVAPGTYTARVTDANGCTDEDEATLSEIPDPSCTVVSTPTRFCAGGSAQLCAQVTGGTGPFTFLWSPGGATTECITVTDGASRTVEITDANGCTTECSGAAIVHPNPSCTVRVNPSTPQCEGTPIELCADVTGGTGPFTYVWTPGGANTSCITVTTAGVYSVEVTDSFGCTTECEGTVTYIDCGGEGCTPGYWKQPHHFSDWTAPYVPAMKFKDACVGAVCFDNAFPGKSLLTVLSQPGSASPGPNSLNALGRHTVAALLNAANGGVDYPYSPLEVINMFNAVYPGTDAAYLDLKNDFAGANEAGCPLNGHADVTSDGLVNTDDLLFVLNNWGASGTGDINSDGLVNVADMMVIMNWWGS